MLCDDNEVKFVVKVKKVKVFEVKITESKLNFI